MKDRIIAWLDQHFVPDWRRSWKWPEVQLAALLPFILTVVAENWNFILRVMDYLPQNSLLRVLIIGVVVIAVIGTPIVARLLDTDPPKDV